MSYLIDNYNLVPSQPLKPLGVSIPITKRIGRDTRIVVEVYAIGRGVALVGQCNYPGLGEGWFELEADGKIFVFDPSAARKTKGLVPPIECNIAFIGQSVEAVNKKGLSKLIDGIIHGDGSQKAAILSLPQGYGKNALAPRLAERLGLHLIVDEWNPATMVITRGALHLTNADMQGGAA